MKTRILLDSIFGTTFIFFLIGVVFKFSAFGIFDALDPIGDALSDVEITDLVFSQFRGETHGSEEIVIVNVGELPRAAIAGQIDIISKYQPKVIGIDCLFEMEKDPFGDSLLRASIANAGNVILASKLYGCSEETGQCDTLIGSIPYFNEVAMSLGFANLISDASEQEDYKSNRSFTPLEMVEGREEYALAVEIMRNYDKEKADKFLARGNPYEIINFKGYGRSEGKFFSLDVIQVFEENFDPSIIKDKIVLFGYLGKDFDDKSWEDRYYTPMNENYAGRTNPDMFGVTIHANIIAMILDESYIDIMHEWLSLIVGVLLCFVNVMLFNKIYFEKPDWYDGLTKLIQLAEALILLYLIIIVFHEFSYKLNITLGIVAMLLAGDALEVYHGVVKNLYFKFEKRFIKNKQT